MHYREPITAGWSAVSGKVIIKGLPKPIGIRLEMLVWLEMFEFG